MRKQLWSGTAILLAALLAGCASSAPTAIQGPILGSAHDLAYVLLPGGPGQASGVLLTWDASADSNINAFVINVRSSLTAAWGELAITAGGGGSFVFFDGETGSAQYFISSQDANGDVANGPDTITVNYNPTVPAPAVVTATGFDSAVKLHWSSEARTGNVGVWSYYRVYSEQASPTPPQCPTGSASFGLEGTTQSEDFVVSGLANGTTWCYAVTSVGVLGQESMLSIPWAVGTTSASGGSFDIASAPHATVVVHRMRHNQTLLLRK